MAIAPVTVNDTQAISKVNAAIGKANLVDGKADRVELTAGLSAEAAARQIGLSTEVAARQASVNAESAARALQFRSLPLPMVVHTRPGDALDQFTTSLAGGDPGALPVVDQSLVKIDDAGRVVRLRGDAQLTNRAMYPVEPSRRYLVQFAVQRRVNSPDPDNDAIRCALAWYDQARTLTTQTVVQDLLGITTGSGRQVVSVVVSRAAGDEVDVVAPSSSRYCRPYVQTFGTLVQSDVEIIRWDDVTDASAYSPDLTELEARAAALESVDAGDRLANLESQVTSPNQLRLPTRSDLVAATIAVTVDQVVVLGEDAPNDGGFATYQRTDEAGGEFQSADNAYWRIVQEQVRSFENFDAVAVAKVPPGSRYIRTVGAGELGDGRAVDFQAVETEDNDRLTITDGRGQYWAAILNTDARVPIWKFGPVGLGNDTLAFANAGASGLPVYVPDGDYYVDPTTFFRKVDFRLADGAVVHLRTVSTAAGARSVIFSVGTAANGSIFEGGTLDGQRSVFEPTYPDYGRTENYVTWEGIRGDYCHGLTVRNVRFKNFVTHGLRHAGGDGCTFEHLTFDNCGESYLISYARNCTVRNLIQRNTTNGTTPIFQHGSEIRFLDDSLIEGLFIENFGGTSSGLEPLSIALSFNSCHRMTARGINISKYTGNHLAMALLWNAMEDCHLMAVNIRGFEIGLSGESPMGGTISNVVIDGEYFNLSGTAWPGLQMTIGGVFAAAGSGLAGESVGNQSAQNLKISNVTVTRCGIGVRNDAPNISYLLVDAIGCKTDGWQLVESTNALQSHPAAQRRKTRGVILQACRGVANGWAGLILTGGDFYKIALNVFDNNGQDPAAPYTCGIFIAPNAGELVETAIDDNTVTDNQAYTIIDGASYRPGATDGQNAAWVRLLQPYSVEMGQRIKLKGAGPGGIDLVGKIIDREVDDVLLKFSSATALLMNGNTLAIGNGQSTGPLLTGAGTAWLSLFKFASYLKHPTLDEYRLISYVNSNTSITLESAFSADIPPGSALQVVLCDVEGIPSQATGIVATGDISAPVYLRRNNVKGHPVADYVVNFPGLSAIGADSDIMLAFSTALNTGSDITTIVSGIPFGWKIEWMSVTIDTAWAGFDGQVSVQVRDNDLLIFNAINPWPGSYAAGSVVQKVCTLCPAFETNGAVWFVFSGGADNNPSGGAATLRLRLRKVA